MKIHKVGFNLMILLMVYCSMSMIIISLMAYLCAAIFIFFDTGIFDFNWGLDGPSSIKAGLAAGIPASVGIWILSKLKEQKEKSSSSKD
ncbi:immunity protein [Sodalis sp. RH15]|uniref:immunity protein n=1 Tax=Sodalis sp. RH15 TaxID=3394330 RepID=UPI0039B4A080